MNIFSKNFWSNGLEFSIAAFTGLRRLAEATALVITSGCTIYFAWHYVNLTVLRDVFICAAGIIALRGSYEFLRCLASQEKGHSRG